MTREDDRMTKSEKAKKYISNGRAATERAGAELTKIWDAAYERIYDDFDTLEAKIRRLEDELEHEQTKAKNAAKTKTDDAVIRKQILMDVDMIVSQNFDMKVGADVWKQILDAADDPEKFAKTPWKEDCLMMTPKFDANVKKTLSVIVDARKSMADAPKGHASASGSSEKKQNVTFDEQNVPKTDKQIRKTAKNFKTPDEEVSQDTEQKVDQDVDQGASQDAAQGVSQDADQEADQGADQNVNQDADTRPAADRAQGRPVGGPRRGWALLDDDAYEQWSHLQTYGRLGSHTNFGTIPLDIIESAEVMQHLIDPARPLPKQVDRDLQVWADAVVADALETHLRHDNKRAPIWERVFPIIPDKAWYDTTTPKGKIVWHEHAWLLKNHRQVMWESSYANSDRKQRNRWDSFSTDRLRFISTYIEQFGFVDALQRIRPDTEARKTFHFGTGRVTLKMVAHREGLEGVQAHLNEMYMQIPITRTRNLANSIVPFLRKEIKTVSEDAKDRIREEDEDACAISPEWREERLKKAWVRDLWGDESKVPEYDIVDTEDVETEDEDKPKRPDADGSDDETEEETKKDAKTPKEDKLDRETPRPEDDQTDKKEGGGDSKRKATDEDEPEPTDNKKLKATSEAIGI